VPSSESENLDRSATIGVLDTDALAPSGALLAAHIALDGAIQRGAVADSEYDATSLDLLVRLALAPGGRLRAVELCRQLQLSPSHISRRLDRAEEDQHVERGPDPVDRRAKVVTITEAGLDVVRDFAPRLHAVLDHVIHQTLSDSEIATLIGFLDRIETAALDYSLNHDAPGRGVL
jgi:DNA-binding MarR family transcriptional regulator